MRRKVSSEFIRKSKISRLNLSYKAYTAFLLSFIFLISFGFAQSKGAIQKRYEEDLKKDKLGIALNGELNKQVLVVDFKDKKSVYKVNLEQGNILVIKAKCMPSTGFRWTIDKEENDALELVEQRRAPVLGMGTTNNRIVFKGNKAGVSKINLQYRRVWEKKKPEKDCVVEVTTMGPYTGQFKYKKEKPTLRSVNLKPEDYSFPAAPSSWDWRNNGGETPVKTQISNSCWSFGASASFESVIKIQTGIERDLSEQWLCNCNSYGFSCSGGGWFPQQMFVDYGAVYESEVPFQGTDGTCYPPYSYGEKASAWGYTDGVSDTPWPNYYHYATVQQIKDAVYTYGPVAANAYIGDGFNYYTGGILTSDYGATAGHMMSIVGWDDAGQYWIVKNSWGASWGESGYIRIQYDLCEMGWYSVWIDYQNDPTAPAVANFSADQRVINPGQYVQFTSTSLNNPDTFSWVFSGGNPSTSSQENPSVYYGSAGSYSVTLSCSNYYGSDSKTVQDYIFVDEYCIASVLAGMSDDYISNVSIGSINNPSGQEGYGNFTDLSTQIYAGSSATLYVTMNYTYDGDLVYAWVDTNQNNVFDSNELTTLNVPSVNVADQICTGTITIPSGTPSGNYRMRVRSIFATGGGQPLPCGEQYCETEDYTINVVGTTTNYTLSTNVSGVGSISLNPSGGTYASGTVVTLTANPGSGYQFTGWSGDLSGTSNPASITMNSNKSVTANFSPVSQSYTLTTNVSGSGTISLSPSGGTYSAGTVVTVTANPSSGSTFTGWSGDLSGTSNPTTITMNSNKSITASFSGGSDYCTSSGNDFSYEWIAGVQVGSLNNTSGAAGYTDFTGQSVNLSKGSSVSVSLTPGFASSSYTEYWKIWIDLNQNGDFTDSGEELFSGNGTSSVSGSFTVPSSATSGTTRMRVTMQYNSAPSSCGTFTYGEVEDYTANITGGTTTYTLSTNVSGSGTISLSPSGGSYAAGTVVTVTANASSGWQFDGWSGDLSGTSNPTTITMNGNRSVTANFSEATQYFTLSTSTYGQGSISLSPSGGTYASGTVVTVTANPSSGWQFDGWGGDLSGTTNPRTITMNNNRTVTATFSEVLQDFTLNTSVSGSGTISLSPSGGTYAAGTVVTLTANPSSGYQFTGWSGDLGGSSNPATLTMNSNKSVTATFTPTTQYYTLTTNVTGQGSVSLSPAGGTYAAGTVVTVTATPDTGSTFTGWSGDLSGSTNPTTVTMNSNKSITAEFSGSVDYCTSSGNSYSYEWIAGVQIGSLNNTSGAAGYTDFTSQTVNLSKGSSVNVSLTPGFGSSSYTEYWKVWIDLNQNGVFTDSGEELFSGNGNSNVSGSLTVPSSAMSGTTRMRVTMRYNTAPTSCGSFDYGEVEDYTANITGGTTTYTLSTNVNGQGSISLSPSGGSYAAGTVVTVTANPSSGWQFTGWGGDLSGSTNPTTITMNGNRTITANFSEATQYFTLNTSTSGQGSISLSPSGGTYAAGTVVTLTANASSGWQFVGWSGDLSGTTNPTTITMNSNRTVAANFTEATQYYTLSTSVSGQGSISLSPSGGTYAAGTVVTVTATPDTGSTFSGWSGDLSGSSNPTTITMNGNRSITATFTGSVNYCTSSGNSYTYEWIAGVQVGSLNNSSGAAGYTDFTNQSVNLTKGNSVSVSLTPGFSSSSYQEYWVIWIDLNQNGEFTDSGEELFSGNGTSTVSGSLTVPSSATNGSTRMRVTMRYYQAPTSCGSFDYGEVEDYTVNVQ